jgi:hypothetical protein
MNRGPRVVKVFELRFADRMFGRKVDSRNCEVADGVFHRHTSGLKVVATVVGYRMMFDDVFYDDGGTSSSGSCRVISVIDCVMGNAQIAFRGEVGFGKEHDVNVTTGKKGVQLECMLCQAVGIP